MPPSNPDSRILFFGAGRMGRPIIARLLKNGVPVRFFDPSAEVVAEVSALGASFDPEALESPSAGRIVLCLPTPGDVGMVLGRWRESLGDGSVIIDFTTVPPSSAREFASLLAARQSQYLECPLSGGERGANSGDLVAIASGHRAAFDSVRPLLEIVARKVLYAGETGAASQIKALNQLAYISYNYAFASALRLGEELGFDRDILLEVFRNGAPAHPLIEDRLPRILDSAYKEGFLIQRALKDLECLELPAGISTESVALLELVQGTLAAAVSNGIGPRDLLALSFGRNLHDED